MHIKGVRLLHDRFPTDHNYPFSLEIFRKTDWIGFVQPVTFFIGENGTGKSTLLRAIAKKCNIHIWKEEERHRFHHNRYDDELFRFIDVEWDGEQVAGSFFSSELFRYFAEVLDEWAIADPGTLSYFGNDSLMNRSHGQSHMAFFASRYQKDGLFLLDEPENALSPATQIELLHLLRAVTSQGNVQFLIATHSPILLAYPGADIYSFDTVPIQKVGYEETEYYRVYRDFLNNREKYLDWS
ncbi:MAG: iron-dicitrate transporter ATP-binding subunit [Methanoregulaceae archaeon PtaB.Bin108]|nr:MAG: iron-dicitrate transporter ATP-binding subunit [Methanoregulaceae archaeon PtaB.Bin108]